MSIHNVVGRDLAQKKFVIADEIDPKHAQCIIFFWKREIPDENFWIFPRIHIENSIDF